MYLPKVSADTAGLLTSLWLSFNLAGKVALGTIQAFFFDRQYRLYTLKPDPFLNLRLL